MSGERGSATVVALGWIVALMVLAGGLFDASHRVMTVARLQAATDRAALAAADVVLGVGGQLPCTAAREILLTEEFYPVSCLVEGHSVRVVGKVVLRGVSHTRRAHAGVVDGGE